MIQLSRMLGCTADELAERITVQELIQQMAYDAMLSEGADRGDFD